MGFGCLWGGEAVLPLVGRGRNEEEGCRQAAGGEEARDERTGGGDTRRGEGARRKSRGGGGCLQPSTEEGGPVCSKKTRRPTMRVSEGRKGRAHQ